MSKHTPGPWEAYHNTYYDTWSVCDIGGQFTLTDLYYLDEETHHRIPYADSGDVVEANARLIAAAPDLLAAAEYFTSEGFDPAEGFRRLKAAITKAKGWPA